MALGHSPSIVTSGLALCYDAANIKSFKGEPTTNIVPNASTMSGWGSYSNGNDGTFTTEFGTTGYRIINRGSWNGLYQTIILPSAGTYTISAWFRYWGGASDNNGATVYTSGGGISDTATAIDKSIIGNWQRISMTRTYSTSSFTFYIISYGGTYGASNSTWDVTMPQIEAQSYATTFVNGTRGTTVATGGGWADLTGNSNHGELVNGPTYNSSNGGSLVFDGANDRVDCGTNFSSFITGTNPFTIECWVYPNSTQVSYADIWGNHAGNYTGLVMQNNGGTGNTFAWGFGTGSTWHPGSGFFTLNSLQYNHLVAIRSSSNTLDTYLNGVQVTNTSAIGYSLSPNSSLNFQIGMGFDLNSNRYFNGRISNFKIYNRALTASEVAQNFNAHRGRYGI